MSNVIPIVSSSPPPLDDDADYKWDDNDDDYGNFTCAPNTSATTVNSDSSCNVNWSNSESSLPVCDAFGNESPAKSDHKTPSGGDDLNINNVANNTDVTNNQHSHPSESRLPGEDSEIVEYNDDFKDFAHFDSAEFTDSPAQISRDTTERSPHQSFSLPTAQSCAGSSIVDIAEEDDFQEFAQYSDNVVTENCQKLTVDTPGSPKFSQGENETHTNHILIMSNSSSGEVQSLSPDQYSETVTADIESAGSIRLKNNDPIYSSVSTVDSGVFSADLSPSYHPVEASDICLNIEKEDSHIHADGVVKQGDVPAASSSSAGRSLDVSHSLETSEEHSNNAALCDNSISNKDTQAADVVSDLSSYQSRDSLLSASDNFNNKNLRSDFRSSDTVEGRDSLKEEEDNDEKFSGNGEFSGGRYNGDHKHSTQAQRIEASNHSSSSKEDISESIHSESSAGFLASTDESPSLGCNRTEGHIVESSVEDVSSVEAQNQRELRAINVAGDSDNTVVCEGNVECNNERSVRCEADEAVSSDLASTAEDKDDSVCHEAGCESENHSTACERDLVISDIDAKAVDFIDNEAANVFSVQTGNSVPETFGNCVDDVEEDKEFGDFGSSKSMRDEDCHEVAPITFRTSICEDNESEDDDDFTFDKERPPAFGDDDSNDSDEFGEFGTAGKDVSGGDNNEFGEFDSAHNFQHDKTEADVNKNVEVDDDFGDFGKSEPAEDGDAGWADFEAPSAPSEASDSFRSFTVSQPIASANTVQSKIQTLQDALLSCFSESSLPGSLARPDNQTLSSDQDMNSVNEDDGLLPLETVVDLGLSNALEAKQQTWTVVQHPSKKDPKVRMWAHLKDVDSCHALMYGWHSSHCSKELYATLHIDTQNILFTHKKQAVPFFASGLGILEPVRGGGGALDRKKEKSNIPTMQPILLDNSKSDHQQSSTPQDIPPVDFDWSSSGLTNPLTVFKADSQDTAPSALQPLEEILKKTTPTAKIATNEVLSPEAVRVLQKMPDLSFMQSRVLMFPVKQ